jgi:hypothetical protein
MFKEMSLIFPSATENIGLLRIEEKELLLHVLSHFLRVVLVLIYVRVDTKFPLSLLLLASHTA